MYKDWREWKLGTVDSDSSLEIPELLKMKDESDLNEALSLFIKEARKQDGDRYPGKTLCELVTSIQKYLELNGINIKLLKASEFKLLNFALTMRCKRPLS